MSQNLYHQALRTQMREKRRHLTPLAQTIAAVQIAQQLSQHPVFLARQRIGFYVADDGEIDPCVLLARAFKLGKDCYLPVLQDKELIFGHYTRNTPLQRNRFNILEPVTQQLILGSCLDLLLLPLVAFDLEGNRLGRGGGYYDRSLATIAEANIPFRLGLGYEFQKVAHLAPNTWDCSLHGIATQSRIYLY